LSIAQRGTMKEPQRADGSQGGKRMADFKEYEEIVNTVMSLSERMAAIEARQEVIIDSLSKAGDNDIDIVAQMTAIVGTMSTIALAVKELQGE